MRDTRISAAAGAAIAPGGFEAEPTPLEIDPIPVRDSSFVVVGSLRATVGFEIWRASSPAERRAILREVSGQRPDFVGLLGDLVFCGSSDAAWLEFDRLTSPLKRGRIAAYPVLGNHEYWVSRGRALTNYFGRFPHLGGRRWYATRYGSLGLTFLDSNAQWLSAAAWREQCDWFARLLEHWDANPGIRATLVFLHHPPQGHGRMTSDCIRVQRDMLPPFTRARKTLAMVSGLGRGETCRMGGKAYLAAASRRPGGLRDSASARIRTEEEPAFRYLRLRCGEAALEVEVRGLERDGPGFDTLDRFELRWPDEPTAH